MVDELQGVLSVQTGPLQGVTVSLEYTQALPPIFRGSVTFIHDILGNIKKLLMYGWHFMFLALYYIFVLETSS